MFYCSLCLNDLGTENTNLRGTTHITTNLTANEIRTIYGERVYDGLLEMMNVISYPAEAKVVKQILYSWGFIVRF